MKMRITQSLNPPWDPIINFELKEPVKSGLQIYQQCVLPPSANAGEIGSTAFDCGQSRTETVEAAPLPPSESALNPGFLPGLKRAEDWAKLMRVALRSKKESILAVARVFFAG